MDFTVPPAVTGRQRTIPRTATALVGQPSAGPVTNGVSPRAARRRWLSSQLVAGPSMDLLPPDLGGWGLGAQGTGARLTDLGHELGDPLEVLSVAVAGLLFPVPLWTLGGDPIRRRHLPDVLTGDLIAAVSLTETDGGAHPAATAVTARRSGARWELNGRKPLVVNADVADHLLITAVDSGTGGPTAFVVDLSSPGIEIRSTAGFAGAGLGSVTLEGVGVPDDAVLGTPGRAGAELVPILAGLDRSLLLAAWVGCLHRLVEETVDAAQEVELFGRVKARSQTARFGLADLHNGVDLFTGLVNRALWQMDEHAEMVRVDGTSARLFLGLRIGDLIAAAESVQGSEPGPVLTRIRAAAPLLRMTSGPDVLRPVLAAALTGLG